jgi:hypothetical protein
VRQFGEVLRQLPAQRGLSVRRQAAPVKGQRRRLAFHAPAQRAGNGLPGVGLGQRPHGRLGQRREAVPAVRQAPFAAVAAPHFEAVVDAQQRAQVLQPAAADDDQAVVRCRQCQQPFERRRHTRVGPGLGRVEGERRQRAVVVEQQHCTPRRRQLGPEGRQRFVVVS